MSIEQRLGAFAPRKTQGIAYRETGAGPALVLLHGIGSGAVSWLLQLETLRGFRLIAWDAPGYGESDFLDEAEPTPADYAAALHGLLERLLLKDVTLVGNSLGCLMAGAYAAARPERVRRMLFLGPAGGYRGDRQRLADRLAQFEQLGVEGLAIKRSPTLLGSKAAPGSLDLVQWAQRRVRPQGYRQAVHCLASGNLALDARKFRKKVLVACGAEDVITPEADCKAIAQAFPEAEYRSLAGIGHAPHLEDAPVINRMIAGFAA